MHHILGIWGCGAYCALPASRPYGLFPSASHIVYREHCELIMYICALGSILRLCFPGDCRLTPVAAPAPVAAAPAAVCARVTCAGEGGGAHRSTGRSASRRFPSAAGCHELTCTATICHLESDVTAASVLNFARDLGTSEEPAEETFDCGKVRGETNVRNVCCVPTRNFGYRRCQSRAATDIGHVQTAVTCCFLCSRSGWSSGKHAGVIYGGLL